MKQFGGGGVGIVEGRQFEFFFHKCIFPIIDSKKHASQFKALTSTRCFYSLIVLHTSKFKTCIQKPIELIFVGKKNNKLVPSAAVITVDYQPLENGEDSTYVGSVISFI